MNYKLLLTLFTFTLLFTLFSCSTENKLVVEELSNDDIASLLKTNDSHEDILKVTELSKNLSQVEKVKYKEVTYKRLLELQEYNNDSARIALEDSTIDIEWKKENEVIIAQAKDSLKHYYQTYINSLPDSIVSVEPISTYTEYYSYNYGVKNYNIKFRFKSLKGKKIKYIGFAYDIQPKSIYKTFQEAKKGKLDQRCKLTIVFSKETTGLYEVNYRNEKAYGGHSFQKLTSLNFVPVKINQVILSDGTVYPADIPYTSLKSVEKFTDHPDIYDIEDLNYYSVEDICKHLDPKFEDLETYTSSKKKEDKSCLQMNWIESQDNGEYIGTESRFIQ